MPVARLDRFVAWLVHQQRRRGAGVVARAVLRLWGVDVPRSVAVGPGLCLPHATTGLVLHPSCRLGRDVTIMHGVTVGRADVWLTDDEGTRVLIGDGAILGANAVVLVRAGELLEVGAGTILGAGSVLTSSTGTGEVWAGNPARLVRTLDRGRPDPVQ